MEESESESESLWIVCSLTLRRVNIGESSLWDLGVFLELTVEFEIIWGETIELSSGREETVKDVRACVSFEILGWDVEGCGKFGYTFWDGECMGLKEIGYCHFYLLIERVLVLEANLIPKIFVEFQNVKYPNP